MGMPKRPKQHQIEDISINEFQRLLPREWVYREKDKDYGIDGEVEIFTDDGIATGCIFYIQLKATDSKNKKVQTRVQIDNDTINYFKSLELPTLVIRYVHETKGIYFKWAHTIDRYSQKKESKSFTFHMTDDNKWNDNQPKIISKYLSKYFLLKRKSTLLPLNIYFDFTFNSIKNISSHRLKSFLRTLLDGKKNKFNIVQNIDDSELIINITDDTLFVDLSGISQAYLHSIGSIDYSYEDISDDIFIAISLALIHINRNTDMLKIFKLISLSAKTLQDPKVALQFIYQFAMSKNNKEAIQLWNNIPKLLKDEFVKIEFQFITYSISKENKDIYEFYLLEEIDNHKDLENKSLLGVAYYNYANFLRTIGSEKSFSFYNKALKNNPHYYKEDYIFKEIGGLLFDIGRYIMSVKCYKLGLELKKDLSSLVLYADALMLKGDYLESQKIFKQYFNEKKKDINEEWHLKEAVLNYLITDMRITNQTRSYYTAMNTNVIQKAKVNESDYLDIIINIDALNPLCWFNLSIIYNNLQKEPLKATIGFIICALINRTDTEAWLNAIKSALNTQDYEIILLIIPVAYNNCGEVFLNQLYDFIEEPTDNSESTEKFLNLIENIIDNKSSEEKKTTMRLFDGKKFVNIIDEE